MCELVHVERELYGFTLEEKNGLDWVGGAGTGDERKNIAPSFLWNAVRLVRTFNQAGAIDKVLQQLCESKW